MIAESVYLSAVAGRMAFRSAYRREREANKSLRRTLEQLRTLAIPAGAAFVRRNDDGAKRCIEVLDIIDAALAQKKD